MRYFTGLLVACCLSSAQADVFRCVAPSGDVIVSDTPCDEGERFSKTRPSESVQDTEAARRELARQKAYADRVSAENEAGRRSTSGAFSLPDESSPPPAPTPGLSFPSSSGGSSGGGTGGGGVQRGVPPPPPRN
nr:DUF4124 domain-containing protein [Dechloromonas sp.]